MTERQAGHLRLVHHSEFAGQDLDVLERDGDTWFTAEQIGAALGYSEPAIAINKIYRRHADELVRHTSQTSLVYEAGKREARVFTEQGVYLLTMFSRKPRAAAFRAFLADLMRDLRRGELHLVDNDGRPVMGAGPASQALVGQLAEQVERLTGVVERFAHSTVELGDRVSRLEQLAVKRELQAPVDAQASAAPTPRRARSAAPAPAPAPAFEAKRAAPRLDQREWEAFVAAWGSELGEGVQWVTSLAEFAQRRGLLTHLLAGSTGKHSRDSRLGKALRKLVGHRVAGFEICEARERSIKRWRYYVQRAQ